MVMGLADNSFILSLATWVWGSDPAVTPESCLDSIPYLSAPCFSRLLAKAIGVGIIFASCLNKAPIIRNILSMGSVAGLSVAAVYGDVILYSNAAFYNILQGNPFSAYGETFTLMLQCFVVVALVWRYEPNLGVNDKILPVAGYCVYLFVVFQGE